MENKIEHHEAVKIIKKKLKKIGIEFDKDYINDLRGKHFRLNIGSGNSWAWNSSYNIVRVSISTNAYMPNAYKHFRRQLRNFDIIKGDYTKLQMKINLVIKKDKEFTKETKEQENSENKEFNRVLKLFKKYNPKEIELSYHHFELKHDNLEITIDTDSNRNIQIDFMGKYKDLIKLLDKLNKE